MNKKTITLRLDWTSKTILFLLCIGIWLVAIEPLSPSQANAETITSVELNNTEKLLVEVCNHLNTIKNELSLQLKNISAEQGNIQKDLNDIYKRDHAATEALLKRVDEITKNQLDQLESIKDCDRGIKNIRSFQGSGTRSW